VAHICTKYRLGRSDLYKYRQRSLVALRKALVDPRRGPRRPHNRLPATCEQQVVTLCHDRPHWSSYKVQRCIGPDAPSPRTIQRVRKRHGLDRLPKRAPPVFPSRRLEPTTLDRVQDLVRTKPYLGPERVVWDLQNSKHLTVTGSVRASSSAAPVSSSSRCSSS